MARDVYVDQDECLSCEACVGLCPDVFAIDEKSGKSHVVDPEGASEEEIQEAIDTCPAQCIHWRD